MKKSLLFILLILITVSCRKYVLREHTQSVEAEGQGVQMTVPDILFDDSLLPYTRAVMTPDENAGLSFTWSEGDATGVYSSADGFARFGLLTGDGLSRATFDGGGFSLADGSTYYAFYPYAMSADDKTAIPLTYSGQSAAADNDIASFLSKDYMWASSVASGGNASFTFSHIGAFLRMKISLPAGTAVDRVELMPMYGEVPQTMSFDITRQTASVSTSAPVMSLAAEDLTVPASGVATVWMAMPPQSFSADWFAVQVHSGTDVYSARVAGKAFNAGKAYRWDLTPVDVTSDPDCGFDNVAESGIKTVTTAVGTGQYSGITYIGGTQYAVVDDKLNGGGIVMYDITINSNGTVGNVSKTVPDGTSGSTVTKRDNEGIAYVPSTNTLFVSSEAEQSIKEYDLNGNLTGRAMTVPADLAKARIKSNKGFEALTYNAETGLFWTITESELKKDAAMPGLLRLQGFGMDLKAAGRYLYQMDAPVKTASEASAASSYVFGAPALAALDDGRIIVLEREVYVPKGSTFEKFLNSFTKISIYVVDPAADGSGILRKSLLKSFTTLPLSSFANYEGMCIGPTLPDGRRTLVLVPDSQGGSSGLTEEYVKVITFK